MISSKTSTFLARFQKMQEKGPFCKRCHNLADILRTSCMICMQDTCKIIFLARKVLFLAFFRILQKCPSLTRNYFHWVCMLSCIIDLVLHQRSSQHFLKRGSKFSRSLAHHRHKFHHLGKHLATTDNACHPEFIHIIL